MVVFGITLYGMLVVGNRLFSSKHPMTWNGQPYGELKLAWSRERATATIGDRQLELGRDRRFGDFYLAEGNRRWATADKPSAFTRRFHVLASGRTFVLKRRSMVSSKFQLLDEAGNEIGEILRRGFFSRTVYARIGPQLGFEAQSLVTWLAMVMWRRDEANAA